MEEDKKGKLYHVVDSIKGGCGKTTFSIMLAEYLERDTTVGHTCLLDMDFLGTGMQDLFFGKKGEEIFSKKNIYITDKIRNFRVDDKQFISKVEVQDKILYIGFSNPEYRAKEGYRFSSRHNYVPVVKYGIFRTGVKNLLSNKELEKSILGEIKNVVLDMSPSNDAYSESVKDCLFDKKYSDFMSEKDACNYYLMVGLDASHTRTAKDYLFDFMYTSDKMPKAIFVVFNDVVQVLNSKNEDMRREQYNARIEEFSRKLSGLKEEDRMRVHFMVLNSYSKYAEKTHSQEALCDLPKGEEIEKLFLETPFRYACSMGEQVKEVSEKELTDDEKKENRKIWMGSILKWMQ